MNASPRWPLAVTVLVAACIASILVAACGGEKLPAEKETGPALIAVFTRESPSVDGLLNDPAWQKAESVQLVSCIDGSEPALPTTVRALWDSTCLYLGFECQDPDAASTITGRDGIVYSEEYVAVFLDDDADRHVYATVEIAPTGALRDALVLSAPDGSRRKHIAGWDAAGMRASVSVYGDGAAPGTTDRFWTVEIAVPFEEFPTAPHIPPLPGDTWRCNSYRVELTGGRSYSALAPTGSDEFHVPDKFARLVFRGE